MNLSAAVKKYLELAGGFDQPLHLSRLALPRADVERIFSAWDEDYQISRFMLLSRAGDEELSAYTPELRVYRINNYEYSHVSFRSGIEQLLASA